MRLYEKTTLLDYIIFFSKYFEKLLKSESHASVPDTVVFYILGLVFYILGLVLGLELE
jgi:hypothetical protein